MLLFYMLFKYLWYRPEGLIVILISLFVQPHWDRHGSCFWCSFALCIRQPCCVVLGGVHEEYMDTHADVAATSSFKMRTSIGFSCIANEHMGSRFTGGITE